MYMCRIRSHIEGVKSRYAQTVIVGWAFLDCQKVPELQVFWNGRPVRGLQVWRTERPDILSAFSDVQNQDGRPLLPGFRICFPSSPTEVYRLCFYIKGERNQRQTYVIRGEQAELAGLSGVRKQLKHGLKKLLRKGTDNVCHDRSVASGKPQIREEDPLISVVVPVYCPDPFHFFEMIRSVMDQTYEKWQLCLADGSDDKPAKDQTMECLVKEASGGDARVIYRKLKKNLGISGNTNQALSMAKGEWIAMLDHDDLLEPAALWEVVLAVRKRPEAGFIYTDSCLTDEDGISCYNALYKPSWSPETLYSANYITHFSLIRKDIAEEAGGFDPVMDGAQDWDIFFRVTEKTEEILHIPRVLYRWRTAQTSTARSAETKPYAKDAQLRAINAHFQRTGGGRQAFFQDRNSSLIRVRMNRTERWQFLRYGKDWPEDSISEENGVREPSVYIILFDGVESVSDEVCQELAQWAVQGGIGLVFPLLFSCDGRIFSAGVLTADRGSQVLYQGGEDHTADQNGHTDWYRNVQAQAPLVFAVSAQNQKKYGFIKPEDSVTALAEYAFRLSQKGLRHLMNPFARVVCGPDIPSDLGKRTGEAYEYFRKQSDQVLY